ncbi:hypothetical protein TURU_086119 [Turdus rufiventris]|nr:hypothetical protein TURU_086119 [Turdus rufiventris]
MERASLVLARSVRRSEKLRHCAGVACDDMERATLAAARILHHLRRDGAAKLVMWDIHWLGPCALPLLPRYPFLPTPYGGSCQISQGSDDNWDDDWDKSSMVADEPGSLSSS